VRKEKELGEKKMKISLSLSLLFDHMYLSWSVGSPHTHTQRILFVVMLKGAPVSLQILLLFFFW